MRTPWPYWIDHALIAGVISAAAWAADLTPALYGAAFYAGREIRDREKLGVWDWPGLAAPLIVCGALELWLRVI